MIQIHDLNEAKWSIVKILAFGMIENLDQGTDKLRRPRYAVVAAGVFFLLVCRRFKLDPRRVLDIAGRHIQHSHEVDPMYTRGMEQFLVEEFPDG